MAQRVFGARAALLCAMFAASSWLDKPLQAAVLDGKVFPVRLLHTTVQNGPLEIIESPFNLTVGPGVELTNFGFNQFPPLPGLVDIDISDTSILITLVIDQPFAYQEVFQFVDTTDAIGLFTGGTINPATNWPGFTTSHLTVLGERIDINVSQITGLKGQKILIDITAVPEPVAASLALTAAVGALAAARRRSRRLSVS